MGARLRSSARVALGCLALAALSQGCEVVTDPDGDMITNGPGATTAATTTSGAGGSGEGGGGQGGEGGSVSSGCTADTMCNDGSACTVDTCEAGKCVFTVDTKSTVCDDQDACNGVETCDAAGKCQAGDAVTVDDGDTCTVDSCDPALGVSHVHDASCLSWKPVSMVGAPSPRYRHTAVWTGSKMIVWGGTVTGTPDVTETGGVYDPETDTWTPTSTVGAPSPRAQHEAVWTGSKMLVWGGYDDVGFAVAGGIYDPEADTWSPMSTAGQPPSRLLHTAVWTGKKMIVWGGFNQTYVGTGGQYDPATDTWALTPSAGAPGGRFGHTAVWAFDRMIVWGGNDTFNWHNDGKVFVPDLGPTGTWTIATTLAAAPGVREANVIVWTGNRMIIWGGWNGGPFIDTGSSFDPSPSGGGAWVTTSLTTAPSPRRDHEAVWTGKEMLVWGGCGEDACVKLLGDGGRFAPDFGAGTWSAVPEVPTLTPRKNHTMVWTGTEAIVWGGRDTGPLGTGARAAL